MVAGRGIAFNADRLELEMKVERIGDATLYLGDCLEILPTLEKVDAVVTDPPYGIGTWNDRSKSDGTRFKQDEFEWDKRPTKDVFNNIFRLSGTVIVFGYNHLSDILKPTKKVLVWDKGFRGLHFNDCELAAVYGSGEACRVLNYSPSSASTKQHPTEKPLAVMEWCIKQCKMSPMTILDPFMGSGTTGVACANLGRKFIGIEIEEKYFDIACERITAAYAQGRLFE